MDLDEPIVPLRERASSSEPASSRPKPFDDDYDQSSSRKRQRMETDDPQNTSAADSAAHPEFHAAAAMPSSANEAILPATPTRSANPPTTPNSNKVTLNLRSTRDTHQMPTSPNSPPSPSKAPAQSTTSMEESNTEVEEETSHVQPTIETPSSSLSSGDPEIMLLVSEHEELSDANQSDANQSITIIKEGSTGSDSERLIDPTNHFPFLEDNQTLPEAASRIANYFENGLINNSNYFARFQVWLEEYLCWACRNLEDAFTSYCHNRDFWEAIIEVIRGLTFRKPHFGNWLNKEGSARDKLNSFFESFASLAGQFVVMDLRTLTKCRDTPDQLPVLASRHLLDAIWLLIGRPDTEHLGTYLVQYYSWDWDQTIHKMQKALEDQGASLAIFVDLAKAYVDVLPRFPKLAENLLEVSRYVDFPIRFLAPQTSQYRTSPQPQQYRDRVATAYTFFEMMDQHLNTFLEKNATLLTADCVLAAITALTSILDAALGLQPRPSSAESRLRQIEQSDPEIPKKFMAKAAAARWNISKLIKLITSSQMQLRVCGTHRLCSELLAIYHNRGNCLPEEHPLLRHLAKFIDSASLVEYIVGVGSHPEIINQSRDMFGFLAVTKIYTNHHTDKIWSTVKSSQDPRVVDSILRIINQWLSLVDGPRKMYFCKKLQEIPVESFTPVMRGFCQTLFNMVVKEASDMGMDLEAPPYELCVRLICESTVPTADTPTIYNDVQKWAVKQFESLTSREHVQGPDVQVRLQIYERCLDDLRSDRTADGSLIALGLLVKENRNDLRELVAKPEFVQLLIENFSWRKNRNSITQYLSLFRQVITSNYIKDSTDLGLRLWNKIIGAEDADLEEEVCHSGWDMLIKTLKDVNPDNVFIRACIQQYLPKLPPHLFSKAAFCFAREAIGWVGTEEPPGSEVGAPAIDQNGLEQLWRMVLTSKDNTSFLNCAGNDLVQFYIASPLIQKLPNDKILEMHLAFVDRCLRQLTSAAGKLKSFSEGTTSGDDEPMVIVAPDNEVHEQETIFLRSLFLLKIFMRVHESSPQFARKKVQPPNIEPPAELKGETRDVSYQLFDDDESSDVRTLTIGSLNSGASLIGSIQKAAGFKHFRVHHCGKEIVLSDIDLSKSLEELRLGTHLMLVKRTSQPSSDNGTSPIQLEVTGRFGDLVPLLSMDGTQAKQIYDFLACFPPYGKIVDAIAYKDTTCQELFPAQHPYQSLYAMRSLIKFIQEHFNSPQPDPKLKHRCFTLLIDTILCHEYLDGYTDEDFKVQFFIELLEGLATSFQGELHELGMADMVERFKLMALEDVGLRERLTSNVESEALLHRLMVLQADVQKSSSQGSTALLQKVFWTLLALSSASTCFWMKFKSHPETPQLVQTLLLSQGEVIPKENFADPVKTIVLVCCKEIQCSQVTKIEFMQFFWPLLAELVPRAILHPESCGTVLDLAQNVLVAAGNTSRIKAVPIDGLDLQVHAKKWGQLLTSHKVVQYVGRPVVIDPVAYGLANLLKTSVDYMPPSDIELLRPLGFTLFNTHLFPDMMLESEDSNRVQSPLPLLDTGTRTMIAETVIGLIKDDENGYVSLVKMMANLVPEPSEEGDYMYALSHSYDRHREIRSATGYVGLKNLSNTCYLNSLMTQLFMNLSFREFMVNAHVADSGAQKLLHQTQKLFCEMQNSFRRYADPHELTQAIKTYEELPIDVTIQMDVDEFYNLLFDRWEGQILAADAKAAFRSFYGGQLVQQVKSKECAHISERLEPFSAIQCDIKGKSSLKESLQAYVDGEIMEGDNKYKCSTCDQHVDAVKRTCLKDVPDNLIFHLKRFDYDLREGRRNKLNDHFSFPMDIDMRPYKFDYLTNGPEGSEEDIFELVGVLVHSGTAESGHYYSYIRERPSKDGKSWVEFNDDQVTPFDPSLIEANCFGGYNFQANDFQFDKSFSAYMLFYQRRSFLMEQGQKLGPQLGVEPIKLPIHPSEARTIDDDNALLMRTYTLYDPSHADFVRNLLALQCESTRTCSTEHTTEDAALKMTFNHMDQVFGRAKDTPDFESVVLMLSRKFDKCSSCSDRFIRWLSSSPTTCRHFLLRSPDTIVRTRIVDLIMTAFRSLKRDDPRAYGFSQDSQRPITSIRRIPFDDSDGTLHELNESHGVFGLMLEAVLQLWDNVLISFRAWPEYFGLIGQMMDGVQEAALLMDNGAFFKTMSMIMANYSAEPTPELVRMLNLISRRSPNKPVPWEIVISLMDKFLQAFDHSIPMAFTPDDARPSRSDQFSRNVPFTLWLPEYNCLSLYWTSGRDNIFAGMLLQRSVQCSAQCSAISTNELATQSVLSQLLLKLDKSDLHTSKQIMNAICQGLQLVCKPSSTTNPATYLRAALTFCRCTNHPQWFEQMVNMIKKCMQDEQVYGGLHYLQFFKDLANLSDNKIGLSQQRLWCVRTEDIPQWAPALLVNYDLPARAATEDFLMQTLIEPALESGSPDDDDDDPDSAQLKVIYNTAGQLGLACLHYLDRTYINQNIQILKSHLASIKAVIEACRDVYEDGSDEAIKYAEDCFCVWTGLNRLAVNHLDEEGSMGSEEWDQSDDLSTSSQLLDEHDQVSLIE